MSKKLYLLIAVLAFAVMIVASLGGVQGQATPQANVAVDAAKFNKPAPAPAHN